MIRVLHSQLECFSVLYVWVHANCRLQFCQQSHCWPIRAPWHMLSLVLHKADFAHHFLAGSIWLFGNRSGSRAPQSGASALTRVRLLDWAPDVICWLGSVLEAVSAAVDSLNDSSAMSSGAGSDGSFHGPQASNENTHTAAAVAIAAGVLDCFAAWVRLGSLYETSNIKVVSSKPAEPPASPGAGPKLKVLSSPSSPATPPQLTHRHASAPHAQSGVWNPPAAMPPTSSPAAQHAHAIIDRSLRYCTGASSILSKAASSCLQDVIEYGPIAVLDSMESGILAMPELCLSALRGAMPQPTPQQPSAQQSHIGGCLPCDRGAQPTHPPAFSSAGGWEASGMRRFAFDDVDMCGGSGLGTGWAAAAAPSTACSVHPPSPEPAIDLGSGLGSGLGLGLSLHRPSPECAMELCQVFSAYCMAQCDVLVGSQAAGGLLRQGLLRLAQTTAVVSDQPVCLAAWEAWGAIAGGFL